MKTYKELLNEFEPVLGVLGGAAALTGLAIAHGFKMHKKNQVDFPFGTHVHSKRLGHGSISGHNWVNDTDHGEHNNWQDDKKGSYTKVGWDKWEDSYILTQDLHTHVKKTSNLNEITGATAFLGIGAIGGVGLKMYHSSLMKTAEINKKVFPEGVDIISKEHGRGFVNRHHMDPNSKDQYGKHQSIKNGNYTQICWDNWAPTLHHTGEIHKHIKKI